MYTEYSLEMLVPSDVAGRRDGYQLQFQVQHLREQRRELLKR